ncbi:hypothetical protein BVRB_6g141970 [Beta vulgaris subsp. vulgaris]|nr:hypothetical protein BVRB_6g141970 [Beta vulgaris subsp. vulgaris]
MKKYQNSDNDDEYPPAEDCHEKLLIHSSEDSDNDKREKCITLRSQSKKILAQKISPAMLKDNASDS